MHLDYYTTQQKISQYVKLELLLCVCVVGLVALKCKSIKSIYQMFLGGTGPFDCGVPEEDRPLRGSKHKIAVFIMLFVCRLNSWLTMLFLNYSISHEVRKPTVIVMIPWTHRINPPPSSFLKISICGCVFSLFGNYYLHQGGYVLPSLQKHFA